jgi:hypothetical protein
VKAIDERTAPKKEIDHSAEAAAAAVAMGGGMMGLGGNLMIGDASGYGGESPSLSSSFGSWCSTGYDAGYADPYAQQQYGGYGAPQGGYGGYGGAPQGYY